MRRSNLLVFNDVVLTTNTIWTADELAPTLARYDQLVIFAVADNIPAPGTVTIQIQHSADGRNWINKSDYATGSTGGPGTPELSGGVSTATPYVKGYDYGLNPSLNLVRLQIQVEAALVGCRLRVYVTARDRGHPTQRLRLRF